MLCYAMLCYSQYSGRDLLRKNNVMNKEFDCQIHETRIASINYRPFSSSVSFL